jgi:hypothetical protein
MMSQSLSKESIEAVGHAHGDSISGSADYAGVGGSSTQGAREYAANNVTTLCVQPAIPLLMMEQFVPLALIRGGLRIIFELAPAYQVLSAPPASITEGSVASASATIANPRFVTSFVQPSQEVMQAYLAQYNGEGISYTVPDYQLFQNQVAAGNSSLNAFQHHANVRSARAVYTIQQNVNQNTERDVAVADESSWAVDAGLLLKMNLSAYQYYSGALRFPTQNTVDMTDESNSEALQYYLQCRGLQGIEKSIRPHPNEWMERQTVDGETDSSALVLAAKLGRGDDSYSGLDLSLQPLTTELTYDAVYAINATNEVRYLQTWLESDATITVSADGIVVRR